jgi:hypothetical protein
LKTYDGFLRVPNEAKHLFDSNKDAFLQQVEQTVKESLSRVYDFPASNIPLVFTEPKPAHQEMIDSTIYRKKMVSNSGSATSSAQKNPGNSDVEDNSLSSSFFHSRIDEGDLNSASQQNNMDGAIAEMEKLMRDTDLHGEIGSPMVNRKTMSAVVTPNNISVDSIDRPMTMSDL